MLLGAVTKPRTREIPLSAGLGRTFGKGSTDALRKLHTLLNRHDTPDLRVVMVVVESWDDMHMIVPYVLTPGGLVVLAR